ncbi:MAG: DUF4340 domain-containing protein, partial [Chloroflexi bacterium]
MRLNRNTLILLVVSLIVIVGALLLSNNPASAPDAEPEATEDVAKRLFPDLNSDTVFRFDIVNNTNGEATHLARSPEGVWYVEEATYALEGATVDQVQAVGRMDMFATLEAEDRFEVDDLEPFGLVEPQYTLSVTTDTGEVYTLHVGGKNAANNRYYALVGDDTSTVVTVAKFNLERFLFDLIEHPPYEPTPMPDLSIPEVTPEATAEAPVVESTPEVTVE